MTYYKTPEHFCIGDAGFCVCGQKAMLYSNGIVFPPNELPITLKGAYHILLRSRLMQQIIVPFRFDFVASPFSWLREAFDISLLSTNLSWQDLRHSKLDDDRHHDSMDRHFRVPLYFPMRYKIQCRFWDYSRRPRVLQRRECPADWICCDRCLCRSGLTSATYANSK